MNDQPTDDPSVEIDGAASDDAAPEVDAVDHAVATEEDEVPDELSRVTAERDEYLESLQRVAAEFDNYRKRTERERAAASTQAGRAVLEQLLPIMDSLERAVEALVDVDQAQSGGVAMVEQQLAGVLAARGLNPIAPAENDPFDPQVHEAVQSLPSLGHSPGTLVAVIQTGYRFSDGSLLRPARVVVAAAQEPPAESEHGPA